MIQIDYNARGFAESCGPQLAGTNALTVSFVDVISAALTVGRPSTSAALRYGAYSCAELVYRMFQVVANLDPASGRIARSPAYDGLDPSEKSAISYYCGLTIAKLFVDELLGVPYLQHIACYPPPAVQFVAPLRPDLVGMDAGGRWYVVEAKGRSNVAKASLLDRAKEQTQAVGRVGGVNPHLRLAVVTDFPSGVMRVNLEDPDAPAGRIEDWSISAVQTLQLHYARWLALVETFDDQEFVDIGRQQFAVARLPEVDLVVGLDVRLLPLLRTLVRDNGTSDIVVAELLALLPRETTRPADFSMRGFTPSGLRIGRDAILVAVGTSWEMGGGA